MTDNNNNSVAEENNSTSEKTFTQEDVNRIVGERLAKEKNKSEQSIQQREQELTQREFILNAKEKLNAKGWNHELLEALNTSSEEAFDKSIAIIEKYINNTKTLPPSPKIVAPGNPTMTNTGGDSIRAAMGLNKE